MPKPNFSGNLRKVLLKQGIYETKHKSTQTLFFAILSLVSIYVKNIILESRKVDK